MSNSTAVVGLQWGDEAKGKIVDLLAGDHDLIVRYNGGSNAGHTIVVAGQTFKLSLVPTGILRLGKQAVVANGVVVNPQSFLDEVAKLRQAGVAIDGNLFLSDRAHVIFPYHMKEEAAHEARSGRPIGTTGRGIGPCYQDKVLRTYAIRVGELLDKDHLLARLNQVLPYKNRLLAALDPAHQPFDASVVAEQYAAFGNQLRPFVADTTLLLHQALKQGKRLLFEAAQGSLLDVDHGTYPYVTSSNSSTAGIPGGSGVPSRAIGRVVGVVKAYTSRVGAGPFPTELLDDLGEKIRKTGKEYGTVTGRARRCGWFDAVAVRYSTAINGTDELAVMLLDVLSDFDKLAICIAYEIDGKRTEHFPSDARLLEKAKPIYEWLPGWKRDIAAVRKRADLPPAARGYLDRLEALLERKVGIISVGPDREQTIV